MNSLNESFFLRAAISFLLVLLSSPVENHIATMLVLTLARARLNSGSCIHPCLLYHLLPYSGLSDVFHMNDFPSAPGLFDMLQPPHFRLRYEVVLVSTHY